jgi:hypothetical protein
MALLVVQEQRVSPGGTPFEAIWPAMGMQALGRFES